MSKTPDTDPPRPGVVRVGGWRRNPDRVRDAVLRWGGALLLLAVAAIVAYKAVYPVVKVRRGRDHALDVERLLRRGELKKASVQLKLALHFAPEDPGVLRTAARYCSILRLPQGLTYHEMLLGTGQATDADRRGYVELAVDLGRVDLAARQLRALLQENPKDIGLLHLLVRQQRAARDLASATRTARFALSLRPEEERSQLILGRLLMDRRDSPALRSEGRRLLWGLAVGNGPGHDDAADLLIGDADLSPSERELLARSVAARPGNGLRDQLLVAGLRLPAEPGRSNAVVAETIRSLWPRADAETLPVIGDWASRHGGSDVLLDLIPVDGAHTNRMWAPMRALALADARRWDELAKVLNEAAGPLGSFVSTSLKGRLALSRDRRAEAEGHLLAAIELPGLSVSQCRFIASESERAGFTRLAIRAWQRIETDPEESVGACLQVLRLARPLDDTPLVFDTVKRLNDYIPGDDQVAGERAWFELLLKQGTDHGKDTAAMLAKKYPAEPRWRYLAALAELRAGRPEPALAMVEADLGRWTELEPRWQLVGVLALAENQQREAARGLARRIDPKKLRSAELQLLTPWL